MQAFLKEVVQLKDLNQKLPDFFPDYVEQLVTVDEQEKKEERTDDGEHRLCTCEL